MKFKIQKTRRRSAGQPWTWGLVRNVSQTQERQETAMRKPQGMTGKWGWGPPHKASTGLEASGSTRMKSTSVCLALTSVRVPKQVGSKSNMFNRGFPELLELRKVEDKDGVPRCLRLLYQTFDSSSHSVCVRSRFTRHIRQRPGQDVSQPSRNLSCWGQEIWWQPMQGMSNVTKIVQKVLGYPVR